MFTVNYEFYSETYGGTAVDETAWPRYQMRASVMLDRLTYGHIKEENEVYGQYICGTFVEFTEEELNYLSFAFCSLIDADKMLNDCRDQALAGSSSDGNVKSRTSGGESISYEIRRTAYDDALSDEGAKIKLMKEAVFNVCDPFLFRYNPFYAGLESRWE